MGRVAWSRHTEFCGENPDGYHPRLEIAILPFRATHFPVSASTAGLLHLKDKEGQGASQHGE